jgi:hypothetical protein
LTREFIDLLVTRTPREIKQAFRIVQVLFDEVDERGSDDVESDSEEFDRDDPPHGREARFVECPR